MTAKQSVLVVDDDSTITEFVAYALAKEGYNADTAASAEEAMVLAENKSYDLFICDIVLPGVNGFELCRRIRKISPEPVLFLSARDSEMDKVIGLEMGADDYLQKPFGIRELMARVRALRRRAAGVSVVRSTVTVAGFTLDEMAHTISGDHGEIDLTPREFELMACLMRNAGKVLTRDNLLHEAWGWEYITETKTVDAHVKRLRSKIESSGHSAKAIETVRAMGYKLRV